MLTIKNPALGKQSNETGFFIFPTASGMIQDTEGIKENDL